MAMNHVVIGEVGLAYSMTHVDLTMCIELFLTLREVDERKSLFCLLGDRNTHVLLRKDARAKVGCKVFEHHEDKSPSLVAFLTKLKSAPLHFC